MPDSFEISTLLPVTARRIYAAWLSSAEHTAMTGSAAEIDPTIGGKYTAWDSYISGTTIELERDRRIVQSWRTVEFPPDSPDSRLEILLEDVEAGSKLTLKHSHIPAGQGVSYESGWVENYFNPMQEYFAS